MKVGDKVVSKNNTTWTGPMTVEHFYTDNDYVVCVHPIRSKGAFLKSDLELYSEFCAKLWIKNVTSLNEYGAAAMRTMAPHNDLTCAALGLAGESAEAMRAVIAMSIAAGQFADLTKKHTHHGHPLEKEKAIKELGDVLWYFALACKVLGVTPEEVAQTNLLKLLARYPEVFTVEASKHMGG